MRTAILALMIGLTAATPAQAERFALSCTGKIGMTIATPERGYVMEPTQATFVYVIDTDAQTVHVLASDKPKLDEVCTDEKVECTRRFTADRITLAGDSTNSEGSPPVTRRGVVAFDLNRGNGRLETSLELSVSDGSRIRATRSLRCKPTDLPAISA